MKTKSTALLVLFTMLSVPVFASGAWSQNTGQNLKSVERKIQKNNAESQRQRDRADQLKTEINVINVDLVAAANRVQQQEVQVAMLEGELSRLERKAARKGGQLNARRQQFSGVVMALSRIARFPTEALIAQPIPPEDTVRSAILLRAAVPAIETRAKSLRTEIETLASTRAQVESRRSALQGALERLQEAEDRINSMRQRKAALRAEAISKSRVAKSTARKLAKKAKSLRDLVGRLNRQKKANDAKLAKRKPASQATFRAKKEFITKKPSQLHIKPKGVAPSPSVADLQALGKIGLISKARGHLPYPATGRVVGLYGQAIGSGQTRKGISISTRVGGQVISPFDGKVVFSGPFRGYGQLLIIDHGEGYHSLLAGLGRIDVEIGQSVLAGEPVAAMTVKDGLGGGRQPILYVEFRRNNEPINPLPWLVARKGNPKG